MQRVLVTTDLPSWDLQLRSDPPSYALGATTNGEHMCSPLHYMLPDTTQQHQTHHGYSYPPSSHLSSHWVRALQPSTAVTHCLTASYPLQHFYNTLQHSTTLYSLQLYSISTVYNLYNTPCISDLGSSAQDLIPIKGANLTYDSFSS